MTILQLEQISAGYREPVLRDLSLSIQPGELIGLAGPNGAGKSTLLRVMSGLLAPSKGLVRLEGRDLAALSARERARRVALVPQAARVPETFTAWEIVLMGRTPHLALLGGEGPRDEQVAVEAMRRAGCWPLAARRMGELSGGEQQRVLVARALAQEPRLLLCDEPTAHLDLRHQARLLTLLRRLTSQGLTVVAALHDLTLAARYVDRVALLAGGALLLCDRPEVVLSPDWLQRAYGVPALIASHPMTRTRLVMLVPDEEEI